MALPSEGGATPLYDPSIDPATGLPWVNTTPYTISNPTPIFANPVGSAPGEQTGVPIPGVIDPNTPDPYATTDPASLPTTIPPGDTLPPPPVGGDIIQPPDDGSGGGALPTTPPPPPPVRPPSPPAPPDASGYTPQARGQNNRGQGDQDFNQSFSSVIPRVAGNDVARPGDITGMRAQVPVWARGLMRSPYARVQGGQARFGQIGGFQPEAPVDPAEEQRRQQQAILALGLPPVA